jgi:ribosomal protein S18 acetylase RimI-like enzyme
MLIKEHNMHEFIIRNATPQDAEGIAIVHVKTWQCAYRGQMPDALLDGLSIEKRTEGWRKLLQEPQEGQHSFVVEADGQIVGWCTVGKPRDDDVTPEIGELYGIYIHPDFIGKGYGSALMKHALNVLKNDGYEKATLWVLDTNEKTRCFYESRGWVAEGKTKIDKRDDFDLHETRYIINL